MKKMIMEVTINDNELSDILDRMNSAMTEVERCISDLRVLSGVIECAPEEAQSDQAM